MKLVLYICILSSFVVYSYAQIEHINHDFNSNAFLDLPTSDGEVGVYILTLDGDEYAMLNEYERNRDNLINALEELEEFGRLDLDNFKIWLITLQLPDKSDPMVCPIRDITYRGITLKSSASFAPFAIIIDTTQVEKFHNSLNNLKENVVQANFERLYTPVNLKKEQLPLVLWDNQRSNMLIELISSPSKDVLALQEKVKSLENQLEIWKEQIHRQSRVDDSIDLYNPKQQNISFFFSIPSRGRITGIDQFTRGYSAGIRYNAFPFKIRSWLGMGATLSLRGQTTKLSNFEVSDQIEDEEMNQTIFITAIGLIEEVNLHFIDFSGFLLFRYPSKQVKSSRMWSLQATFGLSLAYVYLANYQALRGETFTEFADTNLPVSSYPVNRNMESLATKDVLGMFDLGIYIRIYPVGFINNNIGRNLFIDFGVAFKKGFTKLIDKNLPDNKSVLSLNSENYNSLLYRNRNHTINTFQLTIDIGFSF